MSLQDLAYNYTPDDTGTPARQPPPVSARPSEEESRRESIVPGTEAPGLLTVGGQPAGAGLPPRQDPYIPPGPPNFPQSRTPMQGLPGWLGALANIWNQLNTKPAGESPGETIRNFLTGQQPQFTNEPFATGEGVEYPPPPVAGGNQQPAPMDARLPRPQLRRPDQTQWPPAPGFADYPVRPKGEPSPYDDTTGQKHEGPTPKPPESKTPPHQPYIASDQRRVPISELGKPDLVMRGMVNYPGMLPGPYGPQPHEWRGIIANSTNFLSRMGSGVIAPMAISLAQLDPAYWKAKQAGETHKTAIAAAQWNLQAKQIAQRQAQESREYAGAFAAYGPQGSNDMEALDAEIRRIGANDPFLLRVLDRAGVGAVERLIRARDEKGMDIGKVTIQRLREQQLRNAEALGEERRLKIEAAKRKAADEAGGLDPYRMRPGGATSVPAATGTPLGAPAAPADAPDGGLEWPTEQDVPAKPAAPETSSTESDDTTDTSGAAAADDQAKAEPDATEPDTKAAETEPQEKPAQTAEKEPSPSDEVLAKAEGAAAAPAGAKPTRLAQADTGTRTDAAPERAPEPKGELPDWLKRAREGATQAPTGAPETTGQAPAAAARPRPVDPLASSPALQAARNHKDAVTGQPDPLDPVKINSDAQKLSMGALLGKDYNQIPKAVRGYIQARRSEIDAELDRLAVSNLSGKEVLDRLDRLVPEFSAALRGWISGDFAVPQSAWKNPNYVARIQALGQKVDPQFNASNFPVRQRTKQSFANGQFARMVVSNATLDFHAARYVENLRKLESIQKNSPMLWAQLQRYLGPSNIGAALGITDKRLQNLIAEIRIDHEIVATEGTRAASGAAPHVSALNRMMDNLDFVKNTVPSAIHAALELQTEAQKRNIALANHYRAVVGLGADKDPLTDVIRGYGGGLGGSAKDAKTGQIIDVGAAGLGSSHLNPNGDELGAYQPVTPQILERAQQMISGQPAAAAAPSGGGGVVNYKKFFGIK